MYKSWLRLMFVGVIAVVMLGCSAPPEPATPAPGPTVPPTEEAEVEEPATEKSSSESEEEVSTETKEEASTETDQVKQLTMNEVFWPENGLAIETDDAFALSRWGIAEGLIKVKMVL